MAKSGVIRINSIIAERVSRIYKKIEDTTVNGFEKISDKFVDSFLTKEGESIKDAHLRLEAEKNMRKKL